MPLQASPYTYKRKIDEILFEYSCIPKQIKSTCDFRNPLPSLVDAFFQSYTEIREKGPCSDTNPHSCKEQMTLDIDEAIKKGNNVAIETTGKKLPVEYVKKFIGYNVVFVYSLASIKTLVRRSKERAHRGFERYIKKKKDKIQVNPAPRVVDVSKDEFEIKIKEIIETLTFLRQTCLKINNKNDDNISKCGPISKSSFYNLVLVDTNKRAAKIIYDHTKTDRFLTDAEFEKMVRDVVYR